MTSGTSAGIDTSARAPSRSAERTSPTAAGGSPARSSAGRSTSSTSAVTVRRAAPPVRSTPAFRLFRSCPATSRATFGRASKFAPTVPIGIRRSCTTRPFARVREPISRSSGSSSAVASTWAASASRRAGSRRRRSSVAFVERSGGRLDVGVVGVEHLERAVPGASPRIRSAPRRRRRPAGAARPSGLPRLVFDQLAHRHFIMYSRSCERAIPAHIERG